MFVLATYQKILNQVQSAESVEGWGGISVIRGKRSRIATPCGRGFRDDERMRCYKDMFLLVIFNDFSLC